MHDELGLFFKGVHRTDIPKRTGSGKKSSRYNDIKNKQYLYFQQEECCSGCEVHFRLRNMQVDHINGPF